MATSKLEGNLRVLIDEEGAEEVVGVIDKILGGGVIPSPSEWNEPVEHELTVYESGSRKLEVTHDGDSHHTKQRKFSKELFVEAECSCGENFLDEKTAWKHVRQPKAGEEVD